MIRDMLTVVRNNEVAEVPSLPLHAQNISIQTGGNVIEFFNTYVAVSQCFSVTWRHFFCEQASNKEAAQEAAWNLVLSHNMLLSTRRRQKR